jgi:hypothetical protein
MQPLYATDLMPQRAALTWPETVSNRCILFPSLHFVDLCSRFSVNSTQHPSFGTALRLRCNFHVVIFHKREGSLNSKLSVPRWRGAVCVNGNLNKYTRSRARTHTRVHVRIQCVPNVYTHSASWRRTMMRKKLKFK